MSRAGGNKGVLAVVGAGIVLGLGVAIVYITVLGPRSERERAQGEVDDWGARWGEARACLVGDQPRSSDGFEALILRETLEPGPDLEEALASCVEPLKHLRRQAGYTSGSEEVESAWSELGEQVTRLAKAHAWRTAREKPRPLSMLRQELATALASVDGAYAELREAAGMEPAPPPGEATLEPAPEGAPITGPEGKPLALRQSRLAGGVLFGWTRTRDQVYAFSQRGPKETELRPITPGVVGSASAASWGLFYRDTPSSDAADAADALGLRAGPLDSAGAPAGDGVLIAAPDPSKATANPIFALGDGDDRAAVYRTAVHRNAVPETIEHLVLARSHDGGATWPDQQELVPEAAVLADLGRRRIDFTWLDGGAVEWLELSSASLAGPFAPTQLVAGGTVENPYDQRPCFAPQSAWWKISGGLYYAKAGAQTASPVPGSGDIGAQLVCDDERLLAIEPRPSQKSGQVLHLSDCRPDKCLAATEVPIPAGAEWAAGLSAKRGPVIAVLANGLLTLWSGDPKSDKALAPRTTLRTPEGWGGLFGLTRWGDALYLVTYGAATENGVTYRIVALPEG